MGSQIMPTGRKGKQRRQMFCARSSFKPSPGKAESGCTSSVSCTSFPRVTVLKRPPRTTKKRAGPPWKSQRWSRPLLHLGSWTLQEKPLTLQVGATVPSCCHTHGWLSLLVSTVTHHQCSQKVKKLPLDLLSDTSIIYPFDQAKARGVTLPAITDPVTESYPLHISPICLLPSLWLGFNLFPN